MSSRYPQMLARFGAFSPERCAFAAKSARATSAEWHRRNLAGVVNDASNRPRTAPPTPSRRAGIVAQAFYTN
jgi:hypothetical protein